MELWKYNYNGDGKKLILLDEDIIGDLKKYKHYFSTDFRVDPTESYIFLIRSYLGQPDYAFVIKDLELTAFTIIMALKGLEYPWAIANDSLKIEESIDKLLDLLFNGIVKQ